MDLQELPARDRATDLFVGTVPARSSQRALSTTVDASTVVAPAIVGVVLAVIGAPGAAAAAVLLAAAALVVWVALLARRGSSLGHAVASTRSVDVRTAAPAGRDLIGAAVGRRLRTTDLSRGRDPLSPLFAPYAFPEVTDRAHRPSRFVRPATVRLDSGQTLSLADSLIIGRDPEAPADAPAATYEWPDLSRTLSKSHVRLEWDGEQVWAIDLGSLNGTAVRRGELRVPLVPFHRTPLPPDARLELGDRDLTVGLPT